MFYLTPSKTKIVPFQHVANIKKYIYNEKQFEKYRGQYFKVHESKDHIFFCNIFYITQGTSLVAQMIKNLLAMQET